MTKHQSALCGGAAPRDCDCSGLPERNDARRRLKAGCELFKAWGWRSGTPTLKWQAVPCPAGFVEQVQLGVAFGPEGPLSVIDEFPVNGPTIEPPNGPTSGPPVDVTAPNRWVALMNLQSVKLAAVGVSVLIPGLAVLLFQRQQRLEKRLQSLENDQNTDTEALIGGE